ncbi:16S rRNA (cytosine(1402)-N(4))-methyltransferase RsmH [Alkalicoccus chagannorensis]|uniref:16S rRNA (cytosine(1402)-N(4))-methyltransferase RsmH n=1 Tax=Alkalicoccus chagannorensis TaxID=427072 RepID=UPI00040A4127|nr:16S rRNA (cytosine(1402)-N(4))-methyltransferase RsmH [Alkalicoccus chagannorensis]
MFEHETVLKEEAVELLAVKPEGVYVDCTLGGGGHSGRILDELNGQGQLYAFDQDLHALESAESRLGSERIVYIQSNFEYMRSALGDHGVTEVDGVLFDLGVSSPQFDVPERGFSYRFDAPLDMRMDQSADLTAKEIVNEWRFQDIYRIIHQFGEEKFAKQIAREIERSRSVKPVETTFELVDIIKTAIPAPARRKGGHPAKRTFQALRIAVNDELGVFERALEQAASLLRPGGRLAVITFHSLEDRICKKFFKQISSLPDIPKGLPVIPDHLQPDFTLITKKPVTPGPEELEGNNRAHSARLRVVEKRKKEDDET